MDNTVVCPKCGTELEIGMFPFCSGNGAEDHIPSHWRSGEITPIVVHENLQTGEFSFPGQADDPVSEGFVKKEIKSIHEYEKFRRHWEERELDKTQAMIQAEKEYRDHNLKERRREIDDAIKRLGLSGRMADAYRKYRDAKRDAKYSALFRRRPNCHNRVIEFDGKNLNIHRL
jgi:hypothetical protein